MTIASSNGAGIKGALERSKSHMAAAVANTDEALTLLSVAAKKEITLVSCDGEPIVVEEAVALQSLTVKQLIEDRKIPLPVNGEILSKVVAFCKHQMGVDADDEDNKGDFDTNFVQVDKHTLSQLQQTAEFLEIPCLRDLTVKAVADMRLSVKQYKVLCPEDISKKLQVFELHNVLAGYDTVQQTIVFVKAWGDAMELHNDLVSKLFKVGNTHAAPTQEERDMILNDFKEVETHVLITTDEHIAGVDFYQQLVNVVVNYDLPVKVQPDGSSEPDYQVYVQRVDRAGRFGKTGGAVFNFLFSDDTEEETMAKIESHLIAAGTTGQFSEVHMDFQSALEKAGLFPSSCLEYSCEESDRTRLVS